MLDKVWDARTFRILFTTLLFGSVLYLLHGARGTLTLFLFATLLAYFLEPMVALLEKPLHSRLAGIAAVYAIILLLLTVLGFIFGHRLADDVRSLAQSLPQTANQLASGELLNKIGASRGLSTEHLQELQHFFITHKPALAAAGAGIMTRMESPASHIWWLILIPILSFFFLEDGPAIAVSIVDLGKTHDEKGTLSGIIQDVNLMLGSYIRAQLILSALTAVVLTIVLSIMRVPYALILGPLAGLFEFVPVVGPAVASALIFGLAILAGYPHLLLLFLFLGAWRVVQDYVNAPRIMGKSLEMPPLATIFGVLAGGELGGVIGALIAVPALAILRILWRRLVDDSALNAQTSATTRASQLPDKAN